VDHGRHPANGRNRIPALRAARGRVRRGAGVGLGIYRYNAHKKKNPYSTSFRSDIHATDSTCKG